MAGEIVMPRMGLTMETGTIVRWLKHEGEQIAAGEPLLEIETDKSSVEIEALETGKLHQIVASEGTEVPVGAVIAYFLKPGEEAGPAPASPAVVSAGSAIVSVAAQQPAALESAAPVVVAKVKASPAARRLARNLGVDLAAVRGSGPDGRVVAWNVADIAATKAEAETKSAARVSPVAQRVAADLGLDLAQVQGSGPGGAITRRDVEFAARALAPHTEAAKAPEVVPFTRIQRVMAERMVHSFTTAPHFYLHTEVDARQLVSLRAELLPRLEQSDQVHLTFTDLLVYFCGRLLPRHPLLMAQWTPEGLRHLDGVHVGIAVETDNGLLVPVLRDVDKLGLVEIARRRAGMTERARLGKLLPDEFEGGVFTISNLGMYRIDSFDAILNPTQAAILAVGRIKERPLVENGQCVAASMLTLSLSVDHRVLDGARAARFLEDLAATVEVPGLSMR